ncbi:stigma-specific STIG1-like protein 1 [Cornus florida]|uniref:stigma-specific STIG1-like protein 1 n=1 Tax=Cornus florida TaxID=4283 RepID=UPI0028A16A60|nr:stigma-specific STIG1-like protein 1 [Cornus florida]
MESSKIWFVLLVLMATTITLFATPTSELESLVHVKEDDASSYFHFHESQEPSSLRGTARFLAGQGPRATTMTCDKYPRVCAAKGSPGRDCCNKQCVNVMSDELNCGKCGKKCKYSELCCQGQCVNPSVDEKNCGKCNKKCKKGSSCVYGMCSYA